MGLSPATPQKESIQERGDIKLPSNGRFTFAKYVLFFFFNVWTENDLLSLVAAVQLTIDNQSRNPVHIRHAQLKAGKFAEKLPELIEPAESIFIKVRKSASTCMLSWLYL